MSKISPAEKIAVFKKALNTIAWSGWNPGDDEVAAVEHIRIALRALIDADELPKRPENASE